MHLYFYVRGINHHVELWKVLAQSQFWKLPVKDLSTGKTMDILTQGALRPSLFGAYEYIFPRDCLPEVLSVFGITNLGWETPLIGRLRMATLRKMFGCRRIPRKDMLKALNIPASTTITNRKRGLAPVTMDAVILHPIGIKDDVDWIENGLEHERL